MTSSEQCDGQIEQQDGPEGYSREELFCRGYLKVVQDGSPRRQYTELGRRELNVLPWEPYNPSAGGAGDLVRSWYMRGRIDEEGLEKGLELVETAKQDCEGVGYAHE